jgi:hypothetical protein
VLITIDDYPLVTFKVGTGETKVDRVWLNKKKEYLEKVWKKSGKKILGKIEDCCGETFTNTSKQKGILVLLNKKTPKNNNGYLNEDNPLEIHLFLAKKRQHQLNERASCPHARALFYSAAIRVSLQDKGANPV